LRYFYSSLFYLALPFVFLRLLWRSRRLPAYRDRWLERLGFCPYKLQECILVHAVSLGETIAAIPLIKALQKQYSQPILVTNMTPTGAARVKAALGDTVLNAYLPYDLPDAMNRFLARVKPSIVIVMETEIWPNLFSACKRKDIPVVITNARLSAKSARGYGWIKSLTKQTLSAVAILIAQGEADANRFIELGMAANKIRITGNLKFDITPPSDIAAKALELRQQLGHERLIWIAASTHPGEEEIILAAHAVIQQQVPQALLILVPRHPERFTPVADLCVQKGFSVVRRSVAQACEASTQVYLSDTMGEMMLMFGVCDVAFIGGSLVKVGGHNMLEPAVMHKPVITGPALFNFAEISELMMKAGGMVIINNAAELAKEAVKLLLDKKIHDEMGENAYGVVEANRGSLQKQIDAINSLQW
jgi:3-deoxy-D-manno-octulosonic-acid transferase